MARSRRRRNKPPLRDATPRGAGDPGESRSGRSQAALAAFRLPPTALPIVALLAVVIVSYAPVFSADYIWDDKIFQEEAPSIQAFSGLPDIWLNPRTIKQEAHYWPLVYTSFWLEHQLWGFSPLGSHMINLLLHCAICVLLWRLLRRLAVPGALLITAVFALHPVHVEAVAWVIARKDLFATLFYLLAVGCWLDYREQRPGPDGGGLFPASRAYLTLLALFIAGMLSKSLVITLPAALLVLVWWKNGRVTERDLLQTLPLFLLGFAITAGDLAFYHDRAVIDFNYAWSERPIIAAKALWFYLGKLLWPYPLIPIYPKWDVNPGNLLNWLPLLAGLALLAVLYLARRRIGRGPLAGALLFAIILSPALGLGINVFMLFSFAADRYQYLAGAALIAVFAAAAVTACRRLSAEMLNAARVCAVLLLLTYGALTFRQTLVYQDDAAFWSHIIEKNPQAHSGYYNLGLALVDKGLVQEGIDAYHQALAHEPDGVGASVTDDGGPGKPDAGTYINLSFALLQLERFEEAAETAQRAVEVDPKALLAHQNLASALHRLQRYEETLAALKQVAKLMKKPTAEHNYHLGHIATLLGRVDEAEGYLLHALRIDPNYQEARHQLLTTYLQAGLHDKARRLAPDVEQTLARMAAARFNDGDYEEALKHYRYALDLAPGTAETYVNLGATLARLGRDEEALQSYRRALAIDPKQRQGLRQLAYTYFNLGRYEQALKQYRRLAALEPNNAEAHVNVGLALARLQRPQEAEASFQRALELDPAQLDALNQLAALRFLHGSFEQALQLYQRIVALNPDNAQAHANLGSALGQSGRLREAIQSYERALALNPQLATARENIKRARERLAAER